MFKKLFNKMTKNTPLDNVHKEFKKLTELSTKFELVTKDYDRDEYKDEIKTQKSILLNNFQTLGYVHNSLGYPKNPLNNSDFLSIQGTPANVFSVTQNINVDVRNSMADTFLNKEAGSTTYTFNLSEVEELKSDMLKLEIKFLDLKAKRIIKPKALLKLAAVAQRKLDNKINNFCELFTGNEDLMKNFIFSNLNGETDHYHNIYEMIERLDFAGFLYSQLKMTNQNFTFGQKALIYIDTSKHDFKNKIEIEKLLKEFKQYRYDFIVFNRPSGVIHE
jgi:hypothetical protein